MSTRQLAFVFPGQGSQRVGMLAEMATQSRLVEDTFAEAAGVLGYDLWELVQNGPQEALNLTERTQPMLLAAGVALWRVWCERGGAMPSLLAGHSLGEFTALVCADSLDFTDAVELVRQRGRFMQSAVAPGEGAMAAVIGLDDQTVNEVCESAAQGAVVAAVNFNSPGQVVIAGQAAAVERAIAGLKAAGAKRALPLPVSAPFHTALMRPAGEQLEAALAAIEVRAPVIPVVNNVNASIETDPASISCLLVEQIASPVQWVACVETLLGQGVVATIECGPGSVLSGLNRRISKTLQVVSLEKPEGFDKASELCRVLGQ